MGLYTGTTSINFQNDSSDKVKKYAYEDDDYNTTVETVDFDLNDNVMQNNNISIENNIISNGNNLSQNNKGGK